MKRFIGVVLLVLTSTAVVAQEKPIDPVAAVKQLYLMTPRGHKTDASFVVWGDGTVNFSVQFGKRYEDGRTLYGHGATPREALVDLVRKSEALSKQIVPQAESDRSKILAIVDGVRSILNSNLPSQ